LGEELLRVRIQLESGQNGQVGIRAKQEEWSTKKIYNRDILIICLG